MRARWKIAITIPIIYALALGVVTWRVDVARDRTEADVKRLARLGDEAGSDLRNDTVASEPLVKACAGQLASCPRDALLSYFAPYEPRLDSIDDGARVAEPHVFLPRRNFQGFSEFGPLNEYADDAHYASLATVFGDLATDLPWEWPDVVEKRSHRLLRFDAVRYVVVSVVEVYLPIRFAPASTFTGGEAVIASRVVDATSGGTLCEGEVDARVAESVLAHEPSAGNGGIDAITMRVIAGPQALESAFRRAIELAPLRAVCAAAGNDACDEIDRELAPSD